MSGSSSLSAEHPTSGTGGKSSPLSPFNIQSRAPTETGILLVSAFCDDNTIFIMALEMIDHLVRNAVRSKCTAAPIADSAFLFNKVK
jgi:hypothetical protein